MFTTPDGVALYTEEDMKEARDTQRTQFIAGTEYGQRAKNGELHDKALKHFREVSQGAMDKDEVLEAYNALAEALGWDTVETLNALFTVCVNFQGNTVAEFADIEADDESHAENEVAGNLDVEDVEISFILSYNGNTCRESANVTWDFDMDDLEFEATQQD